MDHTPNESRTSILVPYSHCHKCGGLYRPEMAGKEWPKRCTNDRCRNLEWHHLNIIGVNLQTVTDGKRKGILSPIRGHAPMIGHPAITGGFQELEDHSSEDAGAREDWEEVLKQLGLQKPDEEDMIPLCSRATGPLIVGRRQNLVFSVNPNPIHVSVFDAFVPDAETSAIEFSWGPRVLAFPSHTYALARYFRDHQGMTVPEAYMKQPRTGDMIVSADRRLPVFETPYAQPLLDDGVWMVQTEDGGDPLPVVLDNGIWTPR
jgi:hypothetical protein